MQLMHHDVMIEMTEARTAERLENARIHRLRKATNPGWRDRVGHGLIQAGLRLVSRPIEVRVRPRQPVPCPPG